MHPKKDITVRKQTAGSGPGLDKHQTTWSCLATRANSNFSSTFSSGAKLFRCGGGAELLDGSINGFISMRYHVSGNMLLEGKKLQPRKGDRPPWANMSLVGAIFVVRYD